jgi:hypothetical protein
MSVQMAEHKCSVNSCNWEGKLTLKSELNMYDQGAAVLGYYCEIHYAKLKDIINNFNRKYESE